MSTGRTRYVVTNSVLNPNCISFLNVGAYVFCVLITSMKLNLQDLDVDINLTGNEGSRYDVSGYGGTTSTQSRESSEEYEFFLRFNLTSWPWVFNWVLQGIFVLAQIIPSIGSLPIVEYGVGVWYAFACLLQVAWVFVYTRYDDAEVSTIILGLLLLTITVIIYSQRAMPSTNALLFWVLEFPFTAYAAWISMLLFSNLNERIAKRDVDVSLQLTGAILTLCLMNCIAGLCLFSCKKPDFAFPITFAWSAAAFSSNKSGETTHDLGIKYACTGVSMIIVLLMVSRIMIWALEARKRQLLPQEHSSVDVAPRGGKFGAPSRYNTEDNIESGYNTKKKIHTRMNTENAVESSDNVVRWEHGKYGEVDENIVKWEHGRYEATDKVELGHPIETNNTDESSNDVQKKVDLSHKGEVTYPQEESEFDLTPTKEAEFHGKPMQESDPNVKFIVQPKLSVKATEETDIQVKLKEPDEEKSYECYVPST